MSLGQIARPWQPMSFPRVSGDEPDAGRLVIGGFVFSPRERG